MPNGLNFIIGFLSGSRLIIDNKGENNVGRSDRRLEWSSLVICGWETTEAQVPKQGELHGLMGVPD
jgi:hypothetical protein